MTRSALPATAYPDSPQLRVYRSAPKHVLWDVALYLAAQAAGAPDAPRGEEALARLLEEWEALHYNGIVAVRAPKLRRRS